jgi:hypothetical protein
MPYANYEEGLAARRAYQKTAAGKAAHKRANAAYRTRARLAVNARARAYRAANTDVVMGWPSMSPEAQRRQTVRYRGRHPDRYAAHVAVNNAVRDGRLIRAGCEVCGVADADAHHDDYSRPLVVRWLCGVHHKQWHRDHPEMK